MPGWHAETEALEKAGKLKVVGIAEEQHSDRTRLFMQWKGMDWPVMADPFNQLGVAAVPITLFVDEHGVIQKKNPEPSDLQEFVRTGFPAPADASEELTPTANKFARCPVPRFVDATVREWEAGTRSKPLTAEEQFQFGVLYRMRFDSAFRQPGDFGRAINHWRNALEMNPNQYIWRRRIQQYGPRLDKPYSFYDWVKTARQEVAARGEDPVALIAEPSGAEFARPARGERGNRPAGDLKHPDPGGKLARDTAGLVSVEAVTVPSTAGDKPGHRVHLTFIPNKEKDAHWNNESGDAVFWADAFPGGVALPAPTGPPATSTEPRTVEFEVFGDAQAVGGTLFFYVCEGKNGVCRYLAKDVSVAID